eukprot:2494265-Rhodomonas_salina.1
MLFLPSTRTTAVWRDSLKHDGAGQRSGRAELSAGSDAGQRGLAGSGFGVPSGAERVHTCLLLQFSSK